MINGLYIEFLKNKAYYESDFDQNDKLIQFRVIPNKFYPKLDNVIYTGNIYKTILLFDKHSQILYPFRDLLNITIDKVLFRTQIMQYTSNSTPEMDKLDLKYSIESDVMDKIAFYIISNYIDNDGFPILKRV